MRIPKYRFRIRRSRPNAEPRPLRIALRRRGGFADVLGDAFQVLLRVNGCHAAAASRRDGLTVDVILHVASRRRRLARTCAYLRA